MLILKTFNILKIFCNLELLFVQVDKPTFGQPSTQTHVPPFLFFCRQKSAFNIQISQTFPNLTVSLLPTGLEHERPGQCGKRLHFSGHFTDESAGRGGDAQQLLGISSRAAAEPHGHARCPCTKKDEQYAPAGDGNAQQGCIDW